MTRDGRSGSDGRFVAAGGNRPGVAGRDRIRRMAVGASVRATDSSSADPGEMRPGREQAMSARAEGESEAREVASSTETATIATSEATARRREAILLLILSSVQFTSI